MAPALSKVAAGSSSQPPKAASEPDCTAKYADAADCPDKVMAAQCANGQVMCFSRKCCLCATAGGRPANARSMVYDHHKGSAHRPETWERDFNLACSRSAIDRIPDSTTRTLRHVRFVPISAASHLPPTQAVVYERFAAGTCR